MIILCTEVTLGINLITYYAGYIFEVGKYHLYRYSIS